MSASALLKSVLASPDDDLPRLVYADWLDEHSDPARAEFIRVQCELAKLPDHDPRFRPLEDREHELLGEHERAWMAAHAWKPREWVWRRGFIDEVCAGHNELDQYPPPSLFDQPITIVRNTGCVLVNDESGIWVKLDRPSWNVVRSLSVAGLHMSIDAVAWFLRYATHPTNNHMPALRELELATLPDLAHLPRLFRDHCLLPRLKVLGFGSVQTAEALDAGQFATTFAAAPLETLRASESGITSDGLRSLLAAPFAATLRHLDISENPIAPDAYRAFQNANPALQLDALDVSGTPLAGISLEPLLHSRPLRSLTKLEMNGCGSARRNMEVLAGSPFWTQATELRAHSGTIPASTLEPLCHSPGPPALRLLDLADNYLRTEGVRLLCDAPWAGSLTWLALSRNYMDDESCRAIAKSGRFTNLRTLHLAHNNRRQAGSDGEQITDVGVLRLAEAPWLATLRLLTLSYTGITEVGVEVALNARCWRLSGLGVAGCNLTSSAAKAIAESPRLARLNWLDLADNPWLRGKALRPLAESPYLSPLLELDCGGIAIDDDVRAIFRERLGPRFSH